jgi:hypothetical protein
VRGFYYRLPGIIFCQQPWREHGSNPCPVHCEMTIIPETPDCNLVRDPEVEDILSQARNPDPQKL